MPLTPKSVAGKLPTPHAARTSRASREKPHARGACGPRCCREGRRTLHAGTCDLPDAHGDSPARRRPRQALAGTDADRCVTRWVVSVVSAVPRASLTSLPRLAERAARPRHSSRASRRRQEPRPLPGEQRVLHRCQRKVQE